MDLFLDLLRSLIYGVIEGITEWLPISSTGHMILAEQVLKFSFSAEFMEMFRVVIQLGAILAVVVMYFKKLWPFCVDNGRDSGLAKHIRWPVMRLWFKIIVACLPAAVLGLALDDWIDAHFYNSVVVAVMLIVYGIAFILIERRPRVPTTTKLSRITYTYNGQTLTLDDADGSWTLAEDSDYHLDESACNTMVTALSSLNAKRQLDAQAGEDYGFDAPELTVTVTAAGQTTTLTFGSSNTVTGDRYVQKDGDTALYTVDASRTACFAYDKAGLFGSFSPAGFATSDVEQVTYTLAGGEKVSLTAGSELAGDGDEADSASYETVWRFAGDADTDLDQDKVQSMLSALSSYVSGQITPADGADPAACGFDAPLAVVQVTTADGTKTLTYASGTDGYYLMVEGDDSIYAVDGSIVQAVTQTADALTAA